MSRIRLRNRFRLRTRLLVQGLGEFLETRNDLRRFGQHGAREFLGIIGTPLRHLGERHHDREGVVYRVLDLAEFLLQLDQFFLGNAAVVFTHDRRFRVEKRDGYA
jgi:hypothetical protein